MVKKVEAAEKHGEESTPRGVLLRLEIQRVRD
jgi:hypothetical protein